MTRPQRAALPVRNQSLADALAATVERVPEHVAVRSEDRELTYRQLHAVSCSLAAALRSRGIGPGDRVAILMTNSIEAVVAQHGVLAAGAAAVLPSPSWTAPELTHAFALTSPRALLADGALLDLCGDLAALGLVAHVGEHRGTPSLWDLVAEQPPSAAGEAGVDWRHREAVLPFSSGTTGLPKAVRHTHGSMAANVVAWCDAARISGDDRLPFFFPLCHVYGILTTHCAAATGATLSVFTRFDLDHVLAEVECQRFTMLFGAAPVALALRDRPDLEHVDLSSLRWFVWGATPMAVDVAEAVTARTGVPWIQAYGLSESPVVHATPTGGGGPYRLDSPGVPAANVRVRVVDLESRADVAAGESGEVLVRGPGVMAGYLPTDADADAFEDGWLRTGDIGWVEPEGWVHLTERAKEMLKVNGHQVAPAEIERALSAHPAVADCAVYGVPDPRTGEVPVAAVVLRVPAEPAEILDWLAEQVAPYKRPRRMVVVDQLPRTPSGKVLRRVLRDRDVAP